MRDQTFCSRMMPLASMFCQATNHGPHLLALCIERSHNTARIRHNRQPNLLSSFPSISSLLSSSNLTSYRRPARPPRQPPAPSGDKARAALRLFRGRSMGGDGVRVRPRPKRGSWTHLPLPVQHAWPLFLGPITCPSFHLVALAWGTTYWALSLLECFHRCLRVPFFFSFFSFSFVRHKGDTEWKLGHIRCSS